MKDMRKGGFTLIELIIVIAILAFIAVVGIRHFGNVRDIQAKKVNLANIKRTAHALETYATIHREQGTPDYFKGFDSLVDASSSGAWYGTPGEIDFGLWSTNSCDARQVHGGLGIYDGSWKVLAATYDKNGGGTGNVPDQAAAMEQNRGMRLTGLYKSLGVYYLTETDVTALRSAGITTVFLHNPSTAQATGGSRGGYCTAVTTRNGVTVSADGLRIEGGGPGFRPDMSAFYQTYVTNGLPVALIIPSSSVYNDFGYDLALTNGVPSESYAKSALAKTKLIAFGIGKNAECVRNAVGIGEAPHNPFYDKTNYRYYLAVFALRSGGQGIGPSCRFAGVLDCAGNTYRAAEYAVDWTTQVDAE